MVAISTTATGMSQRHQIIDEVMTEHTEVDAAINLWEQMATQLIALIGEDGFNSLYARSVFLTQSTFPWLAASSPSPRTDHRFANLKNSLEGQTPAQAVKANRFLLITFTDILASLIGEQLTNNILRMAWGTEALLGKHENNVADSADKLLSGHTKEFKDE